MRTMRRSTYRIDTMHQSNRAIVALTNELLPLAQTSDIANA